MNHTEFQETISKIRETFPLGNGTEWYTQILSSKPWLVMSDPMNIFEDLPNDATTDERLSLKYDNSYSVNKGETPTVSDFEQLFSLCEKIEVDDDNGILLYKDENYMYLPKGKYWTSSFIRDDVGSINPIHIEIKDREIKFSSEYRFCKCLNILGVKKLSYSANLMN